ncbi:MAG: hypothetical protein AAFU64_10930, partial [Bacteroidota bacterium]
MALIKITDLQNTLEDTRKTLLSATNGDGIISRDDLKVLLEQTEDPLQKGFIDFFYHFLIKLEDRPRMRVTEEVIDRGIRFIQEQIIPHFEIKDSFSLPTQEKIAQVHKAALPMAMNLIRHTANQVLLSPLEVSQEIASLSEGLFFDDYGSEAAIGIESFFMEYPPEPFSPRLFVETLGIHPDTPRGQVARIEPANRALLTFIE